MGKNYLYGLVKSQVANLCPWCILNKPNLLPKRLIIIIAILFASFNINAQITTISGTTMHDRQLAVVKKLAQYTANCTTGDPKYDSPYPVARLALHIDTVFAIRQLDTLYTKYQADSSVDDEFDLHAAMHTYTLCKTQLPAALKQKIKNYLTKEDYRRKHITTNLYLMSWAAGFLATEEWADFTDRAGNSNSVIKSHTRSNILSYLWKFFHLNCYEADAFIYNPIDFMAVRMLAEFALDTEVKSKAELVYQSMAVSLLCSWNKGIYVANPMRSKGWGNMNTGYIASNIITSLSWTFFGNPENKFRIKPFTVSSYGSLYALFWMCYQGKVSPRTSILNAYKSKSYPYVHTGMVDSSSGKFYKYAYQSNNYGLATQTEITIPLSSALTSYNYKEIKRTYMAWKSDTIGSHFSVCQDNPERPTDFSNFNAFGYGENPFHRVLQSKQAAIGVYNVPASYDAYKIYVPFTKLGIKSKIESGGWVFCHAGTMLFAFRTIEPYRWQTTPEPSFDVLELLDTNARKGAWILETSEITSQYSDCTISAELNKFKDSILSKTKFDTLNYSTSSFARLKYYSINKDTLDLTFFPPTTNYSNQMSINGNVVSLNDPYIFNNPFVKQKNRSDTIFITNAPWSDTLIWNNNSFLLDANRTVLSAKAINNCKVLLNWSSFQIANSGDYFSVEQSLDGITFFATKKVKQYPIGFENQEYSLQLNQQQPCWYRVVSVEKNGKKSYSNVVVANSSCGDASSLRVFPNPIKYSKSITIEYTSNFPASPGTLLLYGSNGVILCSKKVNIGNGFNSFQLDTSEGNGSQLYVRIMTNDGQVNILKPIIKGGN